MTAEAKSKPGLAGLLSDDEMGPEESEDEDYTEGKTAAAQAAMDAFKSGDVSALESALSDFIALSM